MHHDQSTASNELSGPENRMENIALAMPALPREQLFQLLLLQIEERKRREKKKRKQDCTTSSSKTIGLQGRKGQRIKSSLMLPWQGLDENRGSLVVWCAKRTQWDRTLNKLLHIRGAASTTTTSLHCGQMVTFSACFVLNAIFKMKQNLQGLHRTI